MKKYQCILIIFCAFSLLPMRQKNSRFISKNLFYLFKKRKQSKECIRLLPLAIQKNSESNKQEAFIEKDWQKAAAAASCYTALKLISVSIWDPDPTYFLEAFQTFFHAKSIAYFTLKMNKKNEKRKE